MDNVPLYRIGRRPIAGDVDFAEVAVLVVHRSGQFNISGGSRPTLFGGGVGQCG